MLPIPAAVPSMGTRRVYFIPTAADIDALSIGTDLSAAENLSCYLTRGAGWQANRSQAVITDPRYCSVQDFEQPGAETATLDLQYTTNLNEPTADEARLALAKGTTGILVHLLQVDQDHEEPAVGDWYEAVPVTLGIQSLAAVEDNAVDRINQKAFITGSWTEFQQLVA